VLLHQTTEFSLTTADATARGNFSALEKTTHRCWPKDMTSLFVSGVVGVGGGAD